MKTIPLFLILILNLSCASADKKFIEQRDAFFGRPFLERPLYIDPGLAAVSIGYGQVNANTIQGESNYIEEDTTNFSSNYQFPIEITENLQSNLWYLPVSFTYKLNNEKGFKNKIDFGSSLFYSSIFGWNMLPAASYTQRHISGDNGFEYTLGFSTIEVFDRERYARKFLNLEYIRQLHPQVHLQLGVGIEQTVFQMRCTWNSDFCSDRNEESYSRAYIEDTVYPANARISYIFLKSYEIALSYSHRQMGYDFDYQYNITSLIFTLY